MALCGIGRRRQAGFTLIESVMAVVIIGIAAATIMAVFSTTTGPSYDPLARVQARTVATAYMDEILLRDYGSFGVCDESTRATYSSIWCYDGLNQAPTDQLGNAIGMLALYDVEVNLNEVSQGVAAVQVRVTHPTGVDYLLESRRTDY